MKFWSEDFADFQAMPADCTADGLNRTPTFEIREIPKEAKKLTIICHDPDATGENVWTHWLAWNIPVTIERIIDGKLPKGAVEGVSSFGAKGYGGPNPSPGSGPHRYVFSLYALDQNIDVPAGVDRIKLLDLMAGHVVAQSVWTGIYEHPST